MTIMQKLGLAGLLAAAGCGVGGEETLVQRSPGVWIQGLCKIELTSSSGHGKRRMPTNLPETLAIDTDGDGQYDEAFVARGYFLNVNMGGFRFDDLARATTHYVAPGLGPDKQYFTGFPDTQTMTPEYQAALGLVCRGQ